MSGPAGSQHWMYASGGSFYPYSIDQSLRFDSSTSYLTRTPSSAGNRRTFTLSFWYKNCDNTNGQIIFGSRIDGNNQFTFQKTTASALDFYSQTSGSITVRMITSSVFRDVGAWYHIVLKVDVTTGTSANAIYVNGVEQPLTTDTSSNTDTYVNSTIPHQIGRWDTGGYINAYMAEVHFIDGTALDATSFGETINGIWVPKAYDTADGAYGTNGFYLTYEGTGTATTTQGITAQTNIGDDQSGAGNNFAVSGFAAEDVVPDSPTNNWCTLNFNDSRPNLGWQEGGLRWFSASVAYKAFATMVIPEISDSDTYYAEYHLAQEGYAGGIAPLSNSGSNNSTDRTGFLAWYSNGNFYNNTTTTASGYNPVVGDIISIKAGNGQIEFFLNGTSVGTPYTGLTGSYKFGAWAVGATGNGMYWNFGQDSTFAGSKTGSSNTADQNGFGDFYYAEAANNISLCAANIVEPDIGPNSTEQADDYFNTLLYTGTGSTDLEVNGLSFTPDWLWIKRRDSAQNFSNAIVDSVRGNTKNLVTNRTDAESTSTGTNDIQSFDSDGFTTGPSNQVSVNDSGGTFVAWSWKAGGTAVSNTDGSITSSVSAAPDAGFSIVSYTGTGANATVGHGLSSAPDLVIVKNRSIVSSWLVRHSSLTASQTLLLENTTGVVSTNYWQSTQPDSSVFYVSSNSEANGSTNNLIAYCFANTEGHLKCGSYVGNAATDGPFVYTGFRPALVMIKNTADVTHWAIWDSKRVAYNVNTTALYPSSTDGDNTGTSLYVDFVSNGFKWRSSHNSVNGSNDKFIYLAFAEAPFKYANAR